MILSDDDRSILKAHYMKTRTEEHEKAIELFRNSNNFGEMWDNSFIHSRCVSIDFDDVMTIQEIQEVYNDYISSLDKDSRVKSHCITSYTNEDFGCSGESTVTLEFMLYTLSHDVESMVRYSLLNTVRSFEFKYIHQREGKDTLNYLAFFEGIGITISND